MEEFSHVIVTMLPAVAATSFDGKGECFPGHAIEVELWCKVTNAEGCKRSSALVLQRESTARDVCMALSTGKLPGLDGGGYGANGSARLCRVR